MDNSIQIKQEPLDIVDVADCEQQLQFEVFAAKDVKVEYDDESNALGNDDENCILSAAVPARTNIAFQIVDEKEDVITVNVADDLKSEDERAFIENITVRPIIQLNSDNSKSFVPASSTSKFQQCCPVCPLFFKSLYSLRKHLILHRRNRFFCSNHCGLFFDTLEECEAHEYQIHQMEIIRCNICQHKFLSYEALGQHRFDMHRDLERSVCSFCREWFPSESDLTKHWRALPDGCGRILLEASEISNISPLIITRDTMKRNANQPNISTKRYRLRSFANEAVSQSLTVAEKSDPQRKRKVASKQSIIDDDSSGDANSGFELNLNDIKQEPIDNGESIDTFNTLLQQSAGTNTAQIDIKTEREDAFDDCIGNNNRDAVKNELIWNTEDEDIKPDINDVDYNTILPDFPSRPVKITPITPVASQASINITPNFTLETIPKFKILKVNPTKEATATPIATTCVKTPLTKINLQNSKNMKMLAMKNIKLVKFPTNTNILKLPENPKFTSTALLNAKPISPPSTAYTVISNANKPLMVKLKSVPNQNNMQELKTPEAQRLLQNRNCTITKIEIPAATRINSASLLLKVQKSLLANETNENEANEDVKKILDVVAAERAEASSKLFTVPKKVLDVIENMPQQRRVINNLKTQIRNVQNVLAAVSTASPTKSLTEIPSAASPPTLITSPALNNTADIVKTELVIENSRDSSCGSVKSYRSSEVNNSNANDGASTLSLWHQQSDVPTPLFLKVTNNNDSLVAAARRQYPEYRFVWLCPQCPRQYEKKHAYCGHLVNVHGMCSKEFQGLTVEVKPIMLAKFADGESCSDTAPQQFQLQISHSENANDLDLDGDTLSIDLTGNATITSNSSSSSTNCTEPIKTSAFKRNSTSRNRQNKAQERMYSCEKCGRRCSSKTMLNDHVRGNCSREPQYPCSLCEKKFFSASTLTCHMTIHTGELPHKCNYCEKRFRTRGQVTVHHRTHTGEKPFICPVCSQGFTHRETLISHLSRHIGMKRYKCYGCNKHFSCISGLRMHRDIRPDTCGKIRFNSRAVGPRVRVIKGKVIFEAQPAINPYLRTEDPEEVLAEIQNQQKPD